MFGFFKIKNYLVLLLGLMMSCLFVLNAADQSVVIPEPISFARTGQKIDDALAGAQATTGAQIKSLENFGKAVAAAPENIANWVGQRRDNFGKQVSTIKEAFSAGSPEGFADTLAKYRQSLGINAPVASAPVTSSPVVNTLGTSVAAPSVAAPSVAAPSVAKPSLLAPNFKFTDLRLDQPKILGSRASDNLAVETPNISSLFPKNTFTKNNSNPPVSFSAASEPALVDNIAPSLTSLDSTIAQALKKPNVVEFLKGPRASEIKSAYPEISDVQILAYRDLPLETIGAKISFDQAHPNIAPGGSQSVLSIDDIVYMPDSLSSVGGSLALGDSISLEKAPNLSWKEWLMSPSAIGSSIGNSIYNNPGKSITIAALVVAYAYYKKVYKPREERFEQIRKSVETPKVKSLEAGVKYYSSIQDYDSCIIAANKNWFWATWRRQAMNNALANYTSPANIIFADNDKIRQDLLSDVGSYHVEICGYQACTDDNRAAREAVIVCQLKSLIDDFTCEINKLSADITYLLKQVDLGRDWSDSDQLENLRNYVVSSLVSKESKDLQSRYEKKLIAFLNFKLEDRHSFKGDGIGILDVASVLTPNLITDEVKTEFVAYLKQSGLWFNQTAAELLFETVVAYGRVSALQKKIEYLVNSSFSLTDEKKIIESIYPEIKNVSILPEQPAKQLHMLETKAQPAAGQGIFLRGSDTSSTSDQLSDEVRRLKAAMEEQKKVSALQKQLEELERQQQSVIQKSDEQPSSQQSGAAAGSTGQQDLSLLEQNLGFVPPQTGAVARAVEPVYPSLAALDDRRSQGGPPAAGPTSELAKRIGAQKVVGRGQSSQERSVRGAGVAAGSTDESQIIPGAKVTGDNTIKLTKVTDGRIVIYNPSTSKLYERNGSKKQSNSEGDIVEVNQNLILQDGSGNRYRYFVGDGLRYS